MREEQLYFQVETLMPDEREVVLFAGRNEGVSTPFIENEELLRKLALSHN